MLVSLGEHCDFLGGFAFKSQDLKEPDGIPVIKIKNVNDRVVNLDDVQFFSVEKMSRKLERFLLADGDVLIAMTGQGSVGRVGRFRNINNQKVLLNQRVGKFLPKESLDLRYLYYILSSEKFEKILFNAASGSGQPNLSPDTIKSIKIPYLPKNEQIHVAEVLGKLDDKIELNKQTNKTLEQMAQALFKSWFVDFDPVIDNALAAGKPIPDELAHRVEVRKQAHALPASLKGKEQPLPEHIRNLFPSEFEQTGEPTVGIYGWIPKGWSLKNISDLNQINPESWTKKNAPSAVAYVDLANAKNGTILDVTNFSFEEAPSRARRVLRKHDIILGVVRPANRSFAYVNEDGLTGSTGFAVVRALHHSYRAFTYFSLTNKDSITEFARIADGAAYPAIKPEDVANAPCTYSSDKILKKFEEIAGIYLRKKALNEMQVKSLSKVRDTLLPKLISGEIKLNSSGSSSINQEAELQGV